MTLREKVVGMFTGIIVGDCLGMPVESWNRERIAKAFPNGIRTYEDPKGHKYFEGVKKGTFTDDTQLTLAVMQSMIASKTFNMNSQAEFHVKAMQETTAGWGRTTKEAVRRLSNGVSWKKSGKTTDSTLGVGNGIPMKIAPLAVWFSSVVGQHQFISQKIDTLKLIVNFAAMTHYTDMSAIAALMHTKVLIGCLLGKNYDIDKHFFPGVLKEWWKNHVDLSKLTKTPDDIVAQMRKLQHAQVWSDDKIIENFGGGSCYVYHSLPFTYAFFLRNPFAIDSLFEIIAAGGDTDTNASMLGGMLGAINGPEIFEGLTEGIPGFNNFIDTVNQFCDVFDLRVDGLASLELCD